MFLGGEGHGDCTRGSSPEFHFLPLPGHFPPHHCLIQLMGSEVRSWTPRGGARAGGRVVQLRLPRGCPPPLARRLRAAAPGVPPAARHAGSARAGGGGVGVLGGSAAGAFELRAAGGNEKPPLVRGFSKASRKPPTVKRRNWAQ